MQKKKIAILVPALNEKENIKPLMKEIDVVVKREKRPYEVIIIDDGSDDGTFDESKKLKDKYK